MHFINSFVNKHVFCCWKYIQEKIFSFKLVGLYGPYNMGSYSGHCVVNLTTTSFRWPHFELWQRRAIRTYVIYWIMVFDDRQLSWEGSISLNLSIRATTILLFSYPVTVNTISSYAIFFARPVEEWIIIAW